MMNLYNHLGQLNLSNIDEAALEALPAAQQEQIVDLIEAHEEVAEAEHAVVEATDNIQARVTALAEAEAALAKLSPHHAVNMMQDGPRKLAALAAREVDAVKAHARAGSRRLMLRRGDIDAVAAFDAAYPPQAAPDTRAAEASVEKASHALDLARADARAAAERIRIARRRLDITLQNYNKQNPVDDLAIRRAAAAAFTPRPASDTRMPDGYLSKLRSKRRITRVRGDFRPIKA